MVRNQGIPQNDYFKPLYLHLMISKPCVCCSGNCYGECCQIFHNGTLPMHAVQLMRSRYCAYALNLPEYIMETTHRKNPSYTSNKNSWKKSIIQFSLNTIFQRLDIVDLKEEENQATVTFTAHLMQNAQDATFTEKSLFEKVNGRWLYKSGIKL